MENFQNDCCRPWTKPNPWTELVFKAVKNRKRSGYAPINVKPAGGGRRGIGRDFDMFQKIAVKFSTPGQKCEVKYNLISHPEK